MCAGERARGRSRPAPWGWGRDGGPAEARLGLSLQLAGGWGGMGGEEPVSGEPVVFSRRGPDGLHRPVSCTTISLPSRGGGLSPSLGSGLVTCGTVPRDLCRKDGEAGCPPGELWATRSEVTLMRPPWREPRPPGDARCGRSDHGHSEATASITEGKCPQVIRDVRSPWAIA